MKVKKKTGKKRAARLIRHKRAVKKASGTPDKPRLNIFKGSRTLVAQVIDDYSGKTLAGAASNSKEAKERVKGKGVDAAKELGALIAGKCGEKGIKEVIFDKGGYSYHGVIKVFADSARKGGLKF